MKLLPGSILRIERREFEVLQQLSLLGRGRWKVRDPHPRPRGTICTAIVIDDTPAARQLERSLWRLPMHVNGIPHLIVCGRQADKKVWVVTWQEGTDVERYLQKVHEGLWERPSVFEAVRRCKSLAHSLKHLDQYCRIVHGDIKPANLVLPSNPGAMAIIDYGSSWQIERTSTRLAGDGLQAAYSAAELLMSRASGDSRADQFSAAVVLYEMLTLQLPYSGLGGQAGLPINREDVEGTYQPPSQLVNDADRIPKSILTELDRVLFTALQLDADRRYATPKAFCVAMDSLWHHLQGAQDSISRKPSAQENEQGKVVRWLSQLLGGD